MKFLQFLVIIFFTPTLYGQKYHTIDFVKYTCHYNYEYQEDSTSIDSRKIANMNLYIGNKYSKFEHSSMYIQDSLIIAYKDMDQDLALQKIMPHLMGNRRGYFTGYSILKHKHSNKQELYERSSNKYYYLVDSLRFNWNIINQSDTLINGFPCKSAITYFRGRKYHAWYSTNLPINDGPYKFNGLPGLIVKIKDEDSHHIFELTSFESIQFEKPIIINQISAIEIKHDSYNKMKTNESLERLKKYGDPQRIKLSAAKLGSVEAKILSRNNFIERF